MARRPNYRFERAERNRAKEAKKEEKLKRQQERASARSTDETPEPTSEPAQNCLSSALCGSSSPAYRSPPELRAGHGQ